MRIWSLHPKYLDTKGLVALWRETLLAKHVLEGKTRGYKYHPQLTRFKKAKYPIDLINQYLSEVYYEAVNRNFDFDKQKISWTFRKSKLPVTKGQVNYEVEHLLIKLEKRDYNKYKELKSKSVFDNHPIFELVDGEIEEWEILYFKRDKIRQ
jgi:hypothetical protein